MTATKVKTPNRVHIDSVATGTRPGRTRQAREGTFGARRACPDGCLSADELAKDRDGSAYESGHPVYDTGS